jgi:hypothetical protein
MVKMRAINGSPKMVSQACFEDILLAKKSLRKYYAITILYNYLKQEKYILLYPATTTNLLPMLLCSATLIFEKRPP